METTSTVSTTWGALKRVLALSYPIIAANLSQIVMGFVDTAMISRVSTDALAAAARVRHSYVSSRVRGLGGDQCGNAHDGPG